MTDYKEYINALRKCAKEHEKDRTYTGHIIVSDLCRDTANLLEMSDRVKLPHTSEYIMRGTSNGWGEYVGELIRCKDCKWGKEVCGNIECWTDMNLPPEYHGYDWYCPNGERKEE